MRYFDVIVRREWKSNIVSPSGQSVASLCPLSRAVSLFRAKMPSHIPTQTKLAALINRNGSNIIPLFHFKLKIIFYPSLNKAKDTELSMFYSLFSKELFLEASGENNERVVIY